MRKSRRLVPLLLAIALGVAAGAAEGARSRLLSLQPDGLFERNVGQYAPGVSYRARLPELDAAIHADGTVSLYPKGTSDARPIAVRALGANVAGPIEASDPSPYRTHYFRGPGSAQAVVDVPHFERVRIAGLYEGIDIVYRAENARLEFDFLVAPRADPDAIRLEISGASSLAVDASGDLVIARAGAVVKQLKPVAYQLREGRKVLVRCDYRLVGDNRVAIVLGAYERDLPLVIDPVVDYSSYLGGTSADTPDAGVRIGADGYFYVAGTATSSNFPVAGAYDSSLGGSSDAYITKIDPTTGRAAWSTYLGGNNADYATAMAVDASGNVYVGGQAGARFPTTSGAYQTSAPNTYGYVAKIGSAGNTLAYSTLVAGAIPRAMQVDSQGRAIVTGQAGSDFHATTGSYQPGWGGGGGTFSGDAFVLMLNPTGTGAVFATFFGGTGTEMANAIAVDATGAIAIGGYTQSVNLPLTTNPAPLRATLGGSQDGFVAKISSSGSSLLFSTYYGGSTDKEEVKGLAFDPYGNLVLGGYTWSSDFPTVNPVLPLSALSVRYVDFGNNPAYRKGFVAKWSMGAQPAVVFSTFAGGQVDCCDSVEALAVDDVGDIYVAGTTMVDQFHLFQSINAYLPQSIVYNAYASANMADALFSAAYTRDGRQIRFQGYVGGCDFASGCVRTTIATHGAGLALVAGGTPYNWIPIAAANTQPVHKNPNFATTTFLTSMSFEPPSLTLTSPSYASATDTPLTLKAVSVTPGASGAVTFWDGATALGTAALVEGMASFSANLPLGVRQLKATLGTNASPILLMPVTAPQGVCQ